MKVGILTYHRAHNYGAVLQCYALQEVLKGMGHEVEVIDYRQPHIETYYARKIRFVQCIRLIAKLQFYSLKKYWKDVKNTKIRRPFFENFRRRHLICSIPFDGVNIPQIYDRYIIGSDQVWTIKCTYGYDPVFWGIFPHKKGALIYGYAVSANGDFHKCLTNEQIKDNVSRFSDITFREHSICDDINNITNNRFGIALDPTLLTEAKMWNKILNNKWIEQKYVVVYEIRRLKHNPNMIMKKAKAFAKQHGYNVIDLSPMTYSVEDFVSIIKSAQCVFTSSFHATVFSLIFGTPFYSFKLNDGHDGRYTNLLSLLQLDNHVVDEKTEIVSALSFDCHKTHKLLLALQYDSKKYLTSIFI